MLHQLQCSATISSVFFCFESDLRSCIRFNLLSHLKYHHCSKIWWSSSTTNPPITKPQSLCTKRVSSSQGCISKIWKVTIFEPGWFRGIILALGHPFLERERAKCERSRVRFAVRAFQPWRKNFFLFFLFFWDSCQQACKRSYSILGSYGTILKLSESV